MWHRVRDTFARTNGTDLSNFDYVLFEKGESNTFRKNDWKTVTRSSALDANSRPDKKLVTIMSLPVRSCLCRRHSEHFGGPLGPRQWLRLLRRSTCSKRGSVRTVFFFSRLVVFFLFGGRSLPHSRLNSMEKAPDQGRHAWKACPRSIQVHVRQWYRICYRFFFGFRSFYAHRLFFFFISLQLLLLLLLLLYFFFN